MQERNSKYHFCQLLEQNIADEAEAREGYYKILDHYIQELSDREIQEIREIIAEELKHSEILTKMIYRRTGIVAED